MKHYRFKKSVLTAAMLMPAVSVLGGVKADIKVSGSSIQETVSGKSLRISDRAGAMFIDGPNGTVWRTDGHTSVAEGNVGQIINGENMTAEVLFAIDTNVVIAADNAESEKRWAKFVDCLDGNNGFAFIMGRRGQFGAQVYVGSQLVTVTSDVKSTDGKLQLWEWNNLAVTVEGKKVTLYLNGNAVASKEASNSGVKVPGNVILGRDNTINDLYCNSGRQGDFNGAIAHVKISDEAKAPSYTATYADLNVPADRYKNDKDRAKFHGQPGMNWTNETHGLYYNPKDGKYHVIFQRTGSMPLMIDAHYGHIVSDDLVNWRDDKPMIWPSEDYDQRGCWSGCLFADDQINGGKPTIIYTGVEYGETSHANVAYCDDDVNLRKWHKLSNNPVSTHNNVARDTYFYRVDKDNAYFIIGDDGFMRKFRYQGNDQWKEDGTFYSLKDNGENGFTEMPNVTKLPNGKWLMTYTPWSPNVQAKYRIGEIGTDGKFKNFGESQLFDFFANYGFCLMSPSIAKDKEGNLVALGIVADKMATEWNMQKGYAHLFSFPRLVGVDKEGRLTQSAHPSLKTLRGKTEFKTDGEKTLDGTLAINPVRGRQLEVIATYKVGDASFGINFLKNNKGKGGSLTYNPGNHTITLDCGQVVTSDYGMKNASYTLPVYPAKGEEFKMHLFIDHSCVDLFINDRYATSFRVFPNDMGYDLTEVFSNGATTLKSVEAYLLGDGDMSDKPVEPYVFKLPENNGRIAFICDEAGMSAQEKGAYDFFTSASGLKLADNVIKTNEASKISTKNYDALWIHIDRKGISKGYAGLPENFRSEAVINALKEFSAKGGHIYLTGHATQMLEGIGRVGYTHAPNEVATGEGGEGDDMWTVNPKVGPYNHNDHKIYANLEESDAFDWTTYGLLFGGGSNILREDHNSMWNLQTIKYISTEGDNIKKFETDTHSKLLGTWGQEKDGNWAGIAEFYPVQNEDGSASGNIIANGLAACQWVVANGSNACANNLKLLTANVLSYLASADGSKPENPGAATIVKPADPEPPEVLESTGKVALYVGYADAEAADANLQEKGAIDLFTKKYPTGTVLYSGDTDKIKASDFDALWIHAERDGIGAGWENLPEEYKNEAFVSALRTFVGEGGNLFLTKHAVQLVNAIGRTDAVPAEFGNTDPNAKCNRNDIWQTNLYANGTDWSTHPVFSNLPIEDSEYGKLVNMLGPGAVHYDRNVMWKLNDLGGHDAFCAANNADVLGTWGHNGGQAWAGIVEFKPNKTKAASADRVEARKGTIIANGLAAYHLVPMDGSSNPYQDNIDNMTANFIAYLSPKTAEAAAPVLVEKITLSETALTMEIEDEVKVVATVTPDNATNKGVTWSTSNDKVATVDMFGNVTAVGAGKTTITATAKDESGVKATCEVTVNEAAPQPVPVTGIKLSSEALELVEGDVAQLTATVSPENADDTTVTWTSSDENVATVDAEGKVTAVAAGKAVITVAANDGSGVKATCEVSVNAPVPEPVPVTAIAISSTALELVVNDVAQLTATVSPEDADDTTVTWTSSDENVAIVDENGKVTAVAAGKAVITVEANDGSGVKATCEVTVNEPVPDPVPVTAIAISSTALELVVNDVAQLTATVSPENADDTTVTWTSSDENVATVDAEGKVTAIAVGKTTITVEANDGSGVKATCEVTVNEDAAVNAVGADTDGWSVEGNTVSVASAKRVVVANMNGQVFFNGTEGSVTLPQGVYVVRTQGSSTKLIIK